MPDLNNFLLVQATIYLNVISQFFIEKLIFITGIQINTVKFNNFNFLKWNYF